MPTEEQIKQWKEKHGELIELNLNDGKIKIYLQRPETLKAYFATMSRAISATERDNSVEAGEIILRACYLGGDLGERLQDYNKETQEFLSACFHCNNLIRILSGNFQIT
jgi:hypothetical protein